MGVARSYNEILSTAVVLFVRCPSALHQNLFIMTGNLTTEVRIIQVNHALDKVPFHLSSPLNLIASFELIKLALIWFTFCCSVKY